MRFEVTHEFDIPLDAIELAVLSPTLVERLKLPHMEKVVQKSHVMENGVLDRVWAYSADVKLPAFAKPYVTKDMLSWEEHSRYDMKTHESRWSIVLPANVTWSKYFRSEGTYTLLPKGESGSVRVVKGQLDLLVSIMRGPAERLIVKEVKKTFDIEAATLRELATLV